MSKAFYNIDLAYKVATGECRPYDINPELYDEDDDLLDAIDYSYVNRLGIEHGEKVIYWESDYNPSAYRMGEHDGERARVIIEALEDYGIDFDIDLVEKYPGDYK